MGEEKRNGKRMERGKEGHGRVLECMGEDNEGKLNYTYVGDSGELGGALEGGKERGMGRKKMERGKGRLWEGTGVHG